MLICRSPVICLKRRMYKLPAGRHSPQVNTKDVCKGARVRVKAGGGSGGEWSVRTSNIVVGRSER